MENRTIGLEYEFLAIQESTGHAITREQIKAIWRDWATQDHVALYVDYGTKQPVGVWYTQKDGRTFLINTDGGVCLVEFGFLPFASLEECRNNMDEIIAEFLSVAKKHDVVLLGYGMQPKTPHYFPDLKTEKTWYRSFGQLPYFSRYHQLFHTIAAQQPCIDVSYEEMLPTLNALNAIGGVTIALFANTGYGESEKQQAHEQREMRWDILVNDFKDDHIQKICGIPKKPFKSLKDYIEYNWDIYLPTVHRGKTMHVVFPQPLISEYFKKKKWQTFDIGNVIPSEVEPGIEDVNIFNMDIWIQSRPKYFFDEDIPLPTFLKELKGKRFNQFAKQHLTKLYIENRNVAAQSWEDRLVAPAYFLGLIENIDALEKLVKQKTWKKWRALRKPAYLQSLKTKEVPALAKQVVDIAEAGLKKRARGEETHLAPLFDRIANKKSPAMQAIEEIETDGLDAFIDRHTIRV